MSREYNVYASVKRNPLSLYLEGSRDSVKGTEEYIERVRKVGRVHQVTLM